MTGLSQWLHLVAESGCKGVVNNIDARAIGRAADEIDKIVNSHARLLAAAKEAEAFPNATWKWLSELQSAISAAEELKP